jgi:hypothetical protein
MLKSVLVADSHSLLSQRHTEWEAELLAVESPPASIPSLPQAGNASTAAGTVSSGIQSPRAYYRPNRPRPGRFVDVLAQVSSSSSTHAETSSSSLQAGTSSTSSTSSTPRNTSATGRVSHGIESETIRQYNHRLAEFLRALETPHYDHKIPAEREMLLRRIGRVLEGLKEYPFKIESAEQALDAGIEGIGSKRSGLVRFSFHLILFRVLSLL